MSMAVTPSMLIEIELGQFLAEHVVIGREASARDLAALIVELIEAKIEEQTGAVP